MGSGRLSYGFVFALLSSSLGCGDDGPQPSDAGSTGNDGPTFTRVYDEVFSQHGCESPFCHGGAAIGGLNLIFDVAQENLVGVAVASEDCKDKTTKKRVEPGDPDASFLIEKLEGNPSCGLPMPPPPAEPISEAQLQLVRDWIAAGAKND